jgi:hypothetical protein
MAKKNETGIIWGVLLLLVLVAAVGYQQGWFLSAITTTNIIPNAVYAAPAYGNIECVQCAQFQKAVELNNFQIGSTLHCPPLYADAKSISSNYATPKTVGKCQVSFNVPQNVLTNFLGSGWELQLYLSKCTNKGCQDYGSIGDLQIMTPGQDFPVADLTGNYLLPDKSDEWYQIKDVKYCQRVFGIPTPLCYSIPNGLRAKITYDHYCLREKTPEGNVTLFSPGQGCYLPSGTNTQVTADTYTGEKLHPGDVYNWAGAWVLYYSPGNFNIGTYNGVSVICSSNTVYQYITEQLYGGTTIYRVNPLSGTPVECCPAPGFPCDANYRRTDINSLVGTSCDVSTFTPSDYLTSADGKTLRRLECVNGKQQVNSIANPCTLCDPKTEICWQHQCISEGQFYSGIAPGTPLTPGITQQPPEHALCTPWLQKEIYNAGQGKYTCAYETGNIVIVVAVVIGLILLLMLISRPQRSDPYADLSRGLGI